MRLWLSFVNWTLTIVAQFRQLDVDETVYSVELRCVVECVLRLRELALSSPVERGSDEASLVCVPSLLWNVRELGYREHTAVP